MDLALQNKDGLGCAGLSSVYFKCYLTSGCSPVEDSRETPKTKTYKKNLKTVYIPAKCRYPYKKTGFR